MLTQKHIDEIMTEMFKVVGREYDREIVKQEDWFLATNWTTEEEVAFNKWLRKYLKKQFKFTKEYAEKKAGWFIFAYGWRTKDVV